MSDVTRVLAQIQSGDSAAAEQLLPLVYDELRRLAAARLAQEQPGQTLQATALVHEAYLRLVAGGGRGPTDESSGPSEPARFAGRTHFFAAAAEAMRWILVDRARQKLTVKHGGQFARQELIDSTVAATAPPEEVIAVHEVLDRLAAEDHLTADLIKLHYFGGFSIEEAGENLGMTRATAYRVYTYGKAWLRDALQGEGS